MSNDRCLWLSFGASAEAAAFPQRTGVACVASRDGQEPNHEAKFVSNFALFRVQQLKSVDESTATDFHRLLWQLVGAVPVPEQKSGI